MRFFVNEQRGFCIGVAGMNHGLLWRTIEGRPGTIEVQLWLSAFGLLQAEVDAFGKRWRQRLNEIFS